MKRYGENSISLVESLFYYDSVFVVDMLNLLDVATGGNIRWQMAMRSVDELLNDFGLVLEQKYSLINDLSLAFFKEHGGNKELKLTLDNKFRVLRPQIDDVMDTTNDHDKEYDSIIRLISNRSVRNSIQVQSLNELWSKNELKISINDLLASLLHMNLDRLFMGRNRTNEFVVYDLLSRHYKSKLARAKKTVK